MNNVIHHSLEMDEMIIDKPENMKVSHYITSASLTVFFWGIAAWLAQPAFTILAWYINTRIGYEHMVILSGWNALADLAGIYVLSIAAMCGALLGWARLQQWRFRGKEKRKFTPELSNDEVSMWFGTNSFTRRHWMRLRNMNVYFDDENQMLQVKPRNTSGEEHGGTYKAKVKQLSTLKGIKEASAELD